MVTIELSQHMTLRIATAKWIQYLSLPSIPYIPTSPYPKSWLDILILWPLQFYEAIAIIPVSFLRRRLPLVGGVLVIIMALHGIMIRWILDSIHEIIGKIFRSRDPKLNFEYFWLNIQKRYAYFDMKNVNSDVVVTIFGDVLKHNTSEEDLWINMTNIIALLDDRSISITSNERPIQGGEELTYSRSRKPSLKSSQGEYMKTLRHKYLKNNGNVLANNFVFGLLNTEISCGWNIGYLAVTGMEGFVELLESEFLFQSQQFQWLKKKNIRVPELYDLEAMKWALDVIFDNMVSLNGFVLDLRFNKGGGTLLSPLTIASYFTQEKMLAFSIHDKQPLKGFKTKSYLVKPPKDRQAYSGPLVILQSELTSGSAELLSVALQSRKNTERYGNRSSGNLSEVSTFQLPNGWNIQVPYQRCFNYKMELYQSIGIPVKQIFPFSLKDLQKIGDLGLEKAVEFISNSQ